MTRARRTLFFLLAASCAAYAQQINFSNTTSAAPSGSTNVTWQHDTNNPVNISGYIPNGNVTISAFTPTTLDCLLAGNGTDVACGTAAQVATLLSATPQPVTVSSLSGVQYVNASCNGTDAAPAIRAAIATGAGRIILPPCAAGSSEAYYTITSPSTTLYSGQGVFFYLTSGQTFDATGAPLFVSNGALLADAGVNVFFANQQNNVTVQNVNINMNGANNLATSTYNSMHAIWFQGGQYNTARNNVISNDPGSNAIVSGGYSTDSSTSNFTATGNVIENGGTQLAGNTGQADWSAIYTEAAYSLIADNQVLASAPQASAINAGCIELHNSFSRATGNTCQYSYPMVYVANSTGTQTDVEIDNNHGVDVVYGVDFYNTASNWYRIHIHDNHVTLAQNANFTSINPKFVSMYLPSNGVVPPYGQLFDSDFLNNTVVGISGNEEGMALASLHNTKIQGNHFTDMASEGIYMLGAPGGTSDLDISGNTFLGTGTAAFTGPIVVDYTQVDSGVPSWAASTAYQLNQYLTPTTPNGYTYVATTAGTSGTTQPTWPTTVGTTVTDGTAVWTTEPAWTIANLTVQNDTFSNTATAPPARPSVAFGTTNNFSSIAAKVKLNPSYGQVGATQIFSGTAATIDQDVVSYGAVTAGGDSAGQRSAYLRSDRHLHDRQIQRRQVNTYHCYWTPEWKAALSAHFVLVPASRSKPTAFQAVSFEHSC